MERKMVRNHIRELWCVGLLRLVGRWCARAGRCQGRTSALRTIHVAPAPARWRRSTELLDRWRHDGSAASGPKASEVRCGRGIRFLGRADSAQMESVDSTRKDAPIWATAKLVAQNDVSLKAPW